MRKVSTGAPGVLGAQRRGSSKDRKVVKHAQALTGEQEMGWGSLSVGSGEVAVVCLTLTKWVGAQCT